MGRDYQHCYPARYITPPAAARNLLFASGKR
jgi:hypothetical protein